MTRILVALRLVCAGALIVCAIAYAIGGPYWACALDLAIAVAVGVSGYLHLCQLLDDPDDPDFEADLEIAYWRFDALQGHQGEPRPMSERDAYKASVRDFFHRPDGAS